ncbi:MAG TPA: ATP-binding protein [Dongiaceae bacterium]|nr:ATP-binding protein [Dongiaceae bacterium]
MKSIRAFLLLSVSLLVLFALLGSAWLSFDRARFEVDELFDTELAQTARILRSTVNLANSEGAHSESTPVPQVSTHDWAVRAGEELSEEDERTRLGHSYERKIMFKIQRDARVVLASDNFPIEMGLPREAGYRRIRLGEHDWYLFTLLDGDLTYVVGERSDVRQEMVEKIAFGNLVPLLIALPVLLLLLAWTLQRGLQPLVALDRYIQQRGKDNLDPIVLPDSPREIRPIVESINGLLVRLRRSLDSERRFTATASHEMRTPVAVLKVNVQNALKASSETERIQLLQELDVGVDRAGRLINQLLTLNRLEHDDHGYALQELDILPLLREEIAALYPLALQKRQNIELSAAVTTLPLRTIPQLFPLVIRNLVDNAVKYAPVGGRILVTAQAEEDAVLLQVEDSGTGVAPEQQQKIFERFYRLQNDGAAGSGLGLAIVQRVVELLGGVISVNTSAALGGLCIQVTLPRQNQRAKKRQVGHLP